MNYIRSCGIPRPRFAQYPRLISLAYPACVDMSGASTQCPPQRDFRRSRKSCIALQHRPFGDYSESITIVNRVGSPVSIRVISPRLEWPSTIQEDPDREAR